ncbi:Enoyl-CoA hydratase/isomerase [Allomeiothermus silvanus DSM 9946]|uniref:Enoyl-CoA hydratase/isomerase n=1 Tax=Allomeiothermus silvanus (strain ATCC 700542 / DSM 9946 / NBRC 106475 / NCIMB 13440 / VI-R2) TaxID=526227 RepID=D7BDZ3_ALLS1|nr:enoyl-CoA hydratase/isomerase family protein [Allomeiothermus silvanus]ADH63144.1 Enoyl-CoA hydratase/isomerase [Allomeiothermus silvanus DSM 9946]
MSVLTRDHGSLRILTLNDPQRRNPLSPEMVSGLLKALEAAEQEPSVRALILTGAGSAFSAGADLEFLKTVTTAGAEANYAHSRELMRLFHRVYTFPKPTIAAIQGPAVAGGAGLATACDLAVLSETARIGYTEVKIGFVAALVGVILVRNVGEKHAKELLLTGKLVSAREAYRMGLVNRVVPQEQVLDEALGLAEEVIAGAPTSLALTKELLHALPGMGLEDGFRLATIANAWVRETSDLAEGIAAFFEKRAPKFGV